MSAPARTAAVGEAMTVLRADAPAASWLERYPLGDGGLGAMCVGDAPVTVRIGWRGSWLTRMIDPGGTSRLTVDDFIPGRGPGERTNEA
jgi:hypothetical protein